MDSRAHMLIKREYERLKKHPLWGVEFDSFVNDNIFLWIVKINGLKNTIWERGIFQLYVQFDEYYDSLPPSIWFHTIPFHPNIDVSSGKPCSNTLDSVEFWNEDIGLDSIFIMLQDLLSHPQTENAVNQEAATTFLSFKDIYYQMASESIRASIRVNAGLHPFESTDDHPVENGLPENPLTKPDHNPKTLPLPNPSRKHSSLISYDMYHSLWKSIGTSNDQKDNGSEEDATANASTVRALLNEEELKDHLQKQLDHHSSIMYGRFNKEPKKSKKKQKIDKMEKIKMMKKIYLKNNVSTIDETPAPPATMRDVTFEREVSELVNWASNLNEEE